MKEKTIRTGRAEQTAVYLGKMFRMLVYQNDWKVMPMAGIIAFMVSSVVATNLGKTMEGTLIGGFALTCICIWNGCFNSIQVICRERPIIKREHRSGLHISAYITAHMIYQAFLCLCQTLITLAVFKTTNVSLPTKSFSSGYAYYDMVITIFLITYSADIISLFISAVVKTSTTAMTVMPFFLIFQLIFSGGFFELPQNMLFISDFTISKWGLSAVCAQYNYNGLKMVTGWTALRNMREIEINGKEMEYVAGIVLSTYGDEDLSIEGGTLIAHGQRIDLSDKIDENKTYQPLIPVVDHLYEDEEARNNLMYRCSEQGYKEDYSSTSDNIAVCWFYLVAAIVVFATASIIALEFIDLDKR